MSIVTLPQHVAIIVPSTNFDEPLAESEFRHQLDRTVMFLSGRFGGAFALQGFGGWVYASGKLGTEDIAVVVSFAANITTEDRRAVLGYAQRLKNRLNQEAVSVVIDGKFMLI